MMQSLEQFTLANGVTMPAVGFGTWQLDGEVTVPAVAAAIAAGYRHIDTAASYGNETGVAKGILQSGVPRGELFVTGKLWNTRRSLELVPTACRQTLKRLKLEYLDLYLVHWPASPALHPGWREINADTWRGMEQLYEEGLVRAIGVCNYLPHQLETLLETAKTVPMVNQIELHPGQPQTETAEYCAAHGIRLQAWSPLGAGEMLQNEKLRAIAARYGRSAAQVCIRWCLQHGAAPLPKSANPVRMRENIDVFSFALSEEDMREIDEMPYFGGSGYDPDTITKFG